LIPDFIGINLYPEVVDFDIYETIKVSFETVKTAARRMHQNLEC